MSGDLTQLLIQCSSGQGDRKALDVLLPKVYSELKKLAASYLRKENSGHTLQPTALVHEAYIRLIDQRAVQWQNRAHFFGVAAQLMRRLLIDHARSRKADKRGGTATKLSFEEGIHWTPSLNSDGPDLLALDEALTRLTAIDERQGRTVELRYFGGLSIEETAQVLKTSPATVKRDWTLAKAWLHRELSTSP